MKNTKGMIFLLVALAILSLATLIGLFFFFPKEQPKPTTPVAVESPVPTAPLPDEFDPVEWTRNPQTPALQSPAPVPPAGDQGFTVTLPPATTPVPGSALPPSPGATFPGDVPSTNLTPSTVTSTPVQVTPAVPSAPAKAPATKPTPAPKAKVRVTEYWIQVASFKDRYQAENVAKSLETQGLKGTLTTATVNGQTVVRVRVGPYANEAEAGKFLAWLKPVKEYEGAYVTKVAANRAP